MARWDVTSNSKGFLVTYINEATSEIWLCGSSTDLECTWAWIQEQAWAGDDICLDGKPWTYRAPFMAAA